MFVDYVHDLSNLMSEASFLDIQNKLKTQISLISSFGSLRDIKTVAGVDVSYWEESGVTYGACSVVVLDMETKQVIEKQDAFDIIKVNYKAGLLAFRELPIILKAIEKLKCEPDLFMFDGNGYLHNNHMGIATHASFFLHKPTIGVAKNYYKVDELWYKEPGIRKGDYSEVKHGNEVLGLAVRSRVGAKPIFVSCGNNISLDDSYNITMWFIGSESRVPITTRIADIETHLLRNKYKRQQYIG